MRTKAQGKTLFQISKQGLLNERLPYETGQPLYMGVNILVGILRENAHQQTYGRRTTPDLILHHKNIVSSDDQKLLLEDQDKFSQHDEEGIEASGLTGYLLFMGGVLNNAARVVDVLNKIEPSEVYIIGPNPQEEGAIAQWRSAPIEHVVRTLWGRDPNYTL